MKHCDYCQIDYEPRRLRDPDTCPECGGELKQGVVNCHHTVEGRSAFRPSGFTRDADGTTIRLYRCTICGEEGPQ